MEMNDLYEAHLGTMVLIETVTLYYAGVLGAVGLRELGLYNVAYIANTGRKESAIVSGAFGEVEPIRTSTKERLQVVNRNSVVTMIPLNLPIDHEWKQV
jgi:hypothetical protein